MMYQKERGSRSREDKERSAEPEARVWHTPNVDEKSREGPEHNLNAEYESEITRLIKKAGSGDRQAKDELFQKVLPHLKQFARQRMLRERRDHTLSSTEVIHEIYLRFCDESLLSLNDRNHFYAVASIYMRRFLVDYARRHRSQRNNGGIRPGPIDEEAYRVSSTQRNLDLMLDLNQALEELEQFHPGWAKVVEMRYFGQLSFKDIASVMDVNKRTAERYWKFARTWLYHRLRSENQKERA